MDQGTYIATDGYIHLDIGAIPREREGSVTAVTGYSHLSGWTLCLAFS